MKLVICIALFVIVLAGVYSWLKKYTRVMYNESDKSVLNPSRGFYYPIKSENYNDIVNAKEKQMTLLFVMYDIEAFKEKPLSDQKLYELEQCFINARIHGLKIIFRMAYGFESTSKEPHDMQTIQQHIVQVTPILQKNEDILFVVQAGVLGPWGEWHSSTFGNPPNLEARKNVINFLENALPKHTYINVRRPSFVRDMFKNETANRKNAYAGHGISKVGWHNDALLSTESDMGTYHDKLSRNEELAWSKEHNLYVPFGGEMSTLSSYSKAENALSEFESLHTTYLNSEYNKDVLADWKNSQIEGVNAFDHIEKRLGYRLSLSNTIAKKRIKPEGKLRIWLSIINVGFAPIYCDYIVELILQSPYGELHRVPIDVDIRNCHPNDKKSRMYAAISIPKNIKDGQTWNLGLKISDPIEALATDDRYNVKISTNHIEYVDGINYFAKYIVEDGNLIWKTNRR